MVGDESPVFLHELNSRVHPLPGLHWGRLFHGCGQSLIGALEFLFTDWVVGLKLGEFLGGEWIVSVGE